MREEAWATEKIQGMVKPVTIYSLEASSSRGAVKCEFKAREFLGD